MLGRFPLFESIVRRAKRFTEPQQVGAVYSHPFEARNIHPSLLAVSLKLFDDGHYAQATFEAFKYVDKQVQRHSASQEAGFKLMMQVFAGTPPAIELTRLSNQTEEDEQKGYQFIFAGTSLAIRNPRGHEYGIKDDPDTCLDHLGLASMLLRRLEDAGYACSL